jgi:hypothetical protein
MSFVCILKKLSASHKEEARVLLNFKYISLLAASVFRKIRKAPYYFLRLKKLLKSEPVGINIENCNSAEKIKVFYSEKFSGLLMSHEKTMQFEQTAQDGLVRNRLFRIVMITFTQV